MEAGQCDEIICRELGALMELLEPARIIQDEGVSGALHIYWNALHIDSAA